MAETSSITSQRPPSPVPSYHTLPPESHTVLLAGPSSSSSSNTTIPRANGIPNALLSAARNTPDAVLSTLTLTLHHKLGQHGITTNGEHGQAERYLSARTADGRERYRVTFAPEGRRTGPQPVESIVYRDSSNASPSSSTMDDATNREVLAHITPTTSSQGLAVYLHNHTNPLATLSRKTLHATGNFPLPHFTTTTVIDGHGDPQLRTTEDEEAGMQWEVTTHSDFPSTSSNVSLADSIEDGRRRSAHLVLREPHRRVWGGRSRGLGEEGVVEGPYGGWGGGGKGKGKGVAGCGGGEGGMGLSGLHLVDADYNVYADYAHKVGEGELDGDGVVWGQVRFRARAVHIGFVERVDGGGTGGLSEKMDHVFLSLMLLLQACVGGSYS
jgi:hypothetical protein